MTISACWPCWRGKYCRRLLPRTSRSSSHRTKQKRSDCNQIFIHFNLFLIIIIGLFFVLMTIFLQRKSCGRRHVWSDAAEDEGLAAGAHREVRSWPLEALLFIWWIERAHKIVG